MSEHQMKFIYRVTFVGSTFHINVYNLDETFRVAHICKDFLEMQRFMKIMEELV